MQAGIQEGLRQVSTDRSLSVGPCHMDDRDPRAGVLCPQTGFRPWAISRLRAFLHRCVLLQQQFQEFPDLLHSILFFCPHGQRFNVFLSAHFSAPSIL